MNSYAVFWSEKEDTLFGLDLLTSDHLVRLNNDQAETRNLDRAYVGSAQWLEHSRGDDFRAYSYSGIPEDVVFAVLSASRSCDVALVHDDTVRVLPVLNGLSELLTTSWSTFKRVKEDDESIDRIVEHVVEHLRKRPTHTDTEHF